MKSNLDPNTGTLAVFIEGDTSSGNYLYSATVSAARSPTDYTARLIQHRDGVAVPQEARLILWQR